ncbi:MAG: rhomboid family intramembrane serine protease [Candidatus Omnitrophica bacterium]|nr:rhomboid family intramembrane serine protease [Candidatus Omnitrophota bacterium]
MIPIRDTIPARHTAYLVRGLVILNIGVFVWEFFQGPHLTRWIFRLGVTPSAWTLTMPADVLEWPRLAPTLFTSQFLHGGFLHVASNMLYLWIFGDNVEDRLGHGRFLFLYLGSGAVAALTQLAVNPASAIPMIGASGAIAGVLGAYFLLFPFSRITTLIPLIFVWEFVELPAFAFLGLWFLLQWVQGVAAVGVVTDVGGGIAWWAHVGGFVSGLILTSRVRLRRPSF